MKKITTHLLFIFLNLFFVKAQDVKLDWGNSQLKEGANLYSQFHIGTKDSSYYILNLDPLDPKLKCEAGIEKYNLANELLHDIRVNYSINKKRPNYEAVVLTESNIIIFASLSSKWSQYKKLYAISYTFDGKVEKDWTEVAEVTSKYSKHLAKFDIQLTADKKNILIEINEYYGEFDLKKFRFKAITTKLETLWDKNIETGFKSNNVSVHQSYIDNNANLIFVAKIVNKIGGKKNTPMHSYQIMQFDYKKDKIDIYKIKQENLVISNFAFTVNQDDKIILLGLYSNSFEYFIAGIFYERINRTTMESDSFYQTPFPKEVLKNYLSEESIEKGLEIPCSVKLKLIPKDNGGLFLLAESIKHQTKLNTDKTISDLYTFGNIMAINFKQNGTIGWVSTIVKNQISYFPVNYTTGYIYHVNADNIYFIFNSSEKPKDVGENTRFYFPNYLIKVSKLDVNGNLSEDKLYEFKDNKGNVAILVGPFSGQITKEKTKIFIVVRKNSRIGMVNFK
jgi:hypothetical protein